MTVCSMGSASVSQTLPHCSAVMSLHLSPSPSDCRLFPRFLLCTLLCISFICLLFFLCLSSFYSFLSSTGYSAAAETLIYFQICALKPVYIQISAAFVHMQTHTHGQEKSSFSFQLRGPPWKLGKTIELIVFTADSVIQSGQPTIQNNTTFPRHQVQLLCQMLSASSRCGISALTEWLPGCNVLLLEIYKVHIRWLLEQ